MGIGCMATKAPSRGRSCFRIRLPYQTSQHTNAVGNRGVDHKPVNCDWLNKTTEGKTLDMSKHHKAEVPGNVLATAAMTERILVKAGVSLHKAAYRLEELEDEGVAIKAIRFVARGGATGEWLGVITCETENGAVVAFHSGDGFVNVVEGLCNKVVNGSLKWREDEYAK